MTEEFYESQIDRLKTKFGERAYDAETVRALGPEANQMSDDYFRRAVTNWIGTRKHTSPPLLIEFREAKLLYEKGKLHKESTQASTGFNNGLKDVLRRVYKVDTIEEAFEMERLKLTLGGVDEGRGCK